MQIGLKSGMLSLEVEAADFDLAEICGFACRQNPKRGFLFVSKVLGKHYPVKPHKMKQVYNSLASKISNYISSSNSPLFLGFAETATGLSSGVYQAWKDKNPQYSYFIHTTRYHFSDKKVLFNFQEEHSHATGHIVYHPDDVQFSLHNHDTLVLVDDEMTTGKTMSNFIVEFLQLEECKVKKIILVCIKNWMLEESVSLFRQKFPDVQVEFVHVLKGIYSFEKDDSFVCDAMPNVDGNSLPKNSLISKNHGRFGVENFPAYDFVQVLTDIDKTKKTLVLGTGEFSYHPFLLADYLESQGVDVVYQSTTRSPIMVGNDIGHKLSFTDNYDDKIANFVYNVAEDQYEQVIICYETNHVADFNLDKTLKAKNVFFEQLQAQ
jgi:hypoxanthine-guanine phosphoribosyltransferase